MTVIRLILGCLFSATAMADHAAAGEYDTDFNGTWRGYLQRIDPHIESNALPDMTDLPEFMEFAIEISDGRPRVYIF